MSHWPPKGFVRVVAWVTAEERHVLRKAALDANVSVAALIRGLSAAVKRGSPAAKQIARLGQKLSNGR